VKWYNEATDEDRIKGARDGHEFVGLAGNRESVEWLWDHHFAAVAGDTIAFEAWPPKAPYRRSFPFPPLLPSFHLLSCFTSKSWADERQVCMIISLLCGELLLVSFGTWSSWQRYVKRRSIAFS
jgi:hypothetical protein